MTIAHARDDQTAREPDESRPLFALTGPLPRVLSQIACMVEFLESCLVFRLFARRVERCMKLRDSWLPLLSIFSCPRFEPALPKLRVRRAAPRLRTINLLKPYPVFENSPNCLRRHYSRRVDAEFQATLENRVEVGVPGTPITRIIPRVPSSMMRSKG